MYIYQHLSLSLNCLCFVPCLHVCCRNAHIHRTPLPALPMEGVPSNNVNNLDVALRKWRIQEMVT